MLKFNIAFSSAMTFAGILLNFGFKIYLARFMEKQELVIFYLVMDLILLVTYLFVGYKDVFVQQLNNQENKSAIFALSNWFLTACMIPIVFLFIPIANNFYLEPRFDSYQIASIFLVLLFVTNSVISHLNNTLYAYREYKFAAIVELSGSTLIILSFLVITLSSSEMAGHQILVLATLSGYVATVALQTFGISFRLRSLVGTMISFKRTWKQDERRHFINSTNLASMEYFSHRLPILVTPFLMLQFYHLDDLGDFQVVARPIYLALVAVCVEPIYRILFPEFSSMMANHEIEKIRTIRQRFLLYLIVFTVAIISGTWLLAEPVIIWLFTDNYAESHKMLNILIIAIPLSCYRAMSFAILKGAGMFKQTMMIRVASALVFILVVLAGSLLAAPVDILIYGILASIVLSVILSFLQEKRALAQFGATPA